MNQQDKKFQVLIVDDEPDIRERLGNILKRRGYSVLTAEDGLEGLIAARENEVDIVICDINMPRMDGLEFLGKIRTISLKIEVIIVTGDPSVDKCMESIEKNALTYLVKPLTVNDIMNGIGKAESRIHEKEEMLKDSLRFFRSKTLPLSRPSIKDLRMEDFWKLGTSS